MKTLHLNLKKKWFEMILNGIKSEEYRAISTYFINLFIDKTNFKTWGNNDFIRELEYDGLEILELKKYSSIIFSNGYAKNRPQFEIELLEIEIGPGREEWGAIVGKKYFILKLGKIIKNEKLQDSKKRR